MARRSAEETIARNLRDHLARELGRVVVLTLEGAGVHWNVSARAGVRRCDIDCFNYEVGSGALQLGLQGNAHLSKVQSGPAPRARTGAEYRLTLVDRDTNSAIGRTPQLEEAAAATRDWLLAGADLAAIYGRYPFVDEKLRAVQATIGRVGRELTALGSHLLIQRDEDWAGSEFSEAWIYDGARSCRLMPDGAGGVSLALLLLRTQLVRVDGVDAATAARTIAAWFAPDGTIAAVQRITPRCLLTPFAAEFERGDHAAWHWGNVLEQARSSQVLELHRPLLDRIVESEIARRFYSFTSLASLCFSRSSLYPFDTVGLPTVWPVRENGRTSYVVRVDGHQQGEGDEGEAFALVEGALASDKRPTYFGNLDDRICDDLNGALAARGSELRVNDEQHRQWLRLVVRAADGRWCEIRASRSDELGMVRFNRDGQDMPPRIDGDNDAILDAIAEWIAAGGGPA